MRKLVRKAPLKEQKSEIARRNQHEKALENIPGRGDSWCKGPEVEIDLVLSGVRKMIG